MYRVSNFPGSSNSLYHCNKKLHSHQHSKKDQSWSNRNCHARRSEGQKCNPIKRIIVSIAIKRLMIGMRPKMGDGKLLDEREEPRLQREMLDVSVFKMKGDFIF